MKVELLLAHCGDLGIEVEWEHLAPKYRGVYLDDFRRIILDHGLTRVQTVSTLAHEIGHATFRDRCSVPANERRAWEYGASLAIEVQEYAAAEDLVGSHAGALAKELDCTPKLVLAWRRWYLRRYPLELRRLAVVERGTELLHGVDDTGIGGVGVDGFVHGAGGVADDGLADVDRDA